MSAPEKKEDPPGSGGTGGSPAPAAPEPDATMLATVSKALGTLLGAGKATVAEKDAGQAGAPEGSRGPADARFDVSDQVRKAVTDIQEKQQRDSVVEGLRQEVSELKKLGEKAPLQERRVERVMRWRLPEER